MPGPESRSEKRPQPETPQGAQRPLSAPAPASPSRRSDVCGTCDDRRHQAPGERRHRVHGHRGGALFLGPRRFESGRGPQLVRSILQGALPHPARLLRAGVAAAHEFPVLLRRGLGDPQHPLAGTHLGPPGPAQWRATPSPGCRAELRMSTPAVSRECPGALRGCAPRP